MQFFTYELLKRHVFGRGAPLGPKAGAGRPGGTSRSPDISGWRALISGGFAGFSCWFFSYGVDIAKTRIQANRPRFFKHHFFDGGLYEALKEIYLRQVRQTHAGHPRLLRWLQRCHWQSLRSKRSRLLGLGKREAADKPR